MPAALAGSLEAERTEPPGGWMHGAPPEEPAASWPVPLPGASCHWFVLCLD